MDEQTAQAFIANTLRRDLARVLGGQTAYGGDRSYYDVLGYPVTILIEDYAQRYERQDIARRIVDLPAIDTWKAPPAITEDIEQETEVDTTPFIEQFENLNERLKVFSALQRADKLSGIGRFGVLLIGFRDGRQMSEPVDLAQVKGQQSILYLRPLSERFVTVRTVEQDSQSPRFGQPTTYNIKLVLADNTTVTQDVHWTRVLHLAENKGDSLVFGTPRLQPVYNLLDDKMKIVGGTAEATWLNMRPGIAVSVEDDYKWDQAEWDQAVSNYAHDPLRMLKAIGLRVQQIGSSEIADPTGPHDVLISDMAAAANMPQRVLIGSAGGELSAAKEDTRQWAAQIASRQQNYAEPEILRPFLDRLVEFGVLPPPVNGPGAYNVGSLQPDGSYAWPSIIEQDDQEKASATAQRAAAARNLAQPDGSLVLDEDEAREILGYPPREPTPEEQLNGELTQAILAGRRNGRVADEALIANALAEKLERMGAFDEV